MGQLHLEIITDRMLREFNVDAHVGRPEVSYRETVMQPAQGEGRLIRQSGGRGQFAVVWLDIEPLPRGHGVEFVDKTVGGVIPREYISPTEKGVRHALQGGVLANYPVVDIKIALVDGQYHPVDSSAFAFEMAGSLAVQDGMKRAKPFLLEPIMKLEIATPEQFFGDVLADVSGRRGQINNVEQRGHLRVITASVPLAETFGYTTELRSLSQGRATHTMEFDSYEPVPHSLAENVIGRVRGVVRR